MKPRCVLVVMVAVWIGCHGSCMDWLQLVVIKNWQCVQYGCTGCTGCHSSVLTSPQSHPRFAHACCVEIGPSLNE